MKKERIEYYKNLTDRFFTEAAIIPDAVGDCYLKDWIILKQKFYSLSDLFIGVISIIFFIAKGIKIMKTTLFDNVLYILFILFFIAGLRYALFRLIN